VIQNPNERSGISKFGSGVLTVAKGVNKLQKELFDEPPKKKNKKRR